MIQQEKGIGSGGAVNWWVQRITGAALLITLLVHFWVLHFFAPNHGDITYQTVMQRLSHPLWRVTDLVFLVVGLYHGANGALLVIQDYIRNPMVRIAVVGTLCVVALVFLVIGSMTILGLTGVPNG